MGGDPSAPMTPLSRYSLQVEPGLDRIGLAVHEQGLSSNQHAALRGLAARYGASGAGHVRIESPAGDDPVAVQQAYAVRSFLQAAGIPEDRIQMAAYAAPDPRAPVLAGFETLRASIPHCAAEARTMGTFDGQRQRIQAHDSRRPVRVGAGGSERDHQQHPGPVVQAAQQQLEGDVTARHAELGERRSGRLVGHRDRPGPQRPAGGIPDDEVRRRAFELTRQAIGYRMLQLLALPLASLDPAALANIGRS